MEAKAKTLINLTPAKLFRVLQVVNKPQGKSYTTGINLQGEYLNRYGFELGDRVAVEISQNKIIITNQ